MSNIQQNNIDKGKAGEEIAKNYLIKNNFDIIEQNWRYKHLEVDIIASKKNILHIIEVKTRYTKLFGLPEAGYTKQKMENLKKIAEKYQSINPVWKYIQFDIVSIIMQNNEVEEIFFIEDVYF